MKVIRLEPMASPARSRDGGGALPRSTSGKAPPSTPFSSNTSHQPARASVSTPTTPASHHKPLAINTDAPPATPKDKTKSSSYYSSMWSPRKLMQRASRAFRGGKARRKKNKADGDSPTSVTSKGSDAASVLSLDELADEVHGGGGKQEEQHLEVVPEKIIHEANPSVVVNHQPAVAEEVEERIKTPEKDTAAVDEEPEKGAAPDPAPAPAVTDKLMVMKEATKKHAEEAGEDEAVRRFEGSRVKTAMEKRSEEEQPRRREVARSNDVIEEARSKLLERRQCSRVKALVGAFETVMDANHAAAGKPQLHLRKEA